MHQGIVALSMIDEYLDANTYSTVQLEGGTEDRTGSFSRTDHPRKFPDFR